MNQNPAPLHFSAEHLDKLHASLERIAAVADLLSCVGEGIDPAFLQARTVPAAAELILEEAARASHLLEAAE